MRTAYPTTRHTRAGLPGSSMNWSGMQALSDRTTGRRAVLKLLVLDTSQGLVSALGGQDLHALEFTGGRSCQRSRGRH